MASAGIAPMLTALEFVADSDSAVDVPPASGTLPREVSLAASPNLSSGAMSFVPELPGAGAGGVEVFDLSGGAGRVPGASECE